MAAQQASVYKNNNPHFIWSKDYSTEWLVVDFQKDWILLSVGSDTQWGRFWEPYLFPTEI